MLAVKFVPNKFGRVRLELNGHQYMVKTSRGHRRYWKCVVPQCSATINTHYDNITKMGNYHNHAPNKSRVKAENVINKMKERSIKEATPIPTIYEEERALLRHADYIDANPDHEDVLAELPTFYECRMSLYRQRNKEIPKIPTTRNDIDLQGRWTETSAGEKFLLVNDGDDDKILIFATINNLTNLAAAETIYADGTFYTSPSQFSQLYTLHAEVHGAMYPLVFGLLPGKSERIYERFFELVKDVCQRHQITLSPKTFSTDFETAARNAVQRSFPGISLKGCFFHYTQCIWRKTQKLGLATAYKNNPSVKLFVRRAAVLPLLPPNVLEDYWFNAIEDADDIPENITPLADYVTETWVESDNRLHWNHFATEGHRTNNNLEGWHSKLRKLVNHPHPNIYVLIQLLQKEQNATEAKQIQLAAGGSQRPRSRKYREIDHRIARLKEKLQDHQITFQEYGDAASHLLHIN